MVPCSRRPASSGNWQESLYKLSAAAPLVNPSRTLLPVVRSSPSTSALMTHRGGSSTGIAIIGRGTGVGPGGGGYGGYGCTAGGGYGCTGYGYG